MSHRAVFDIGKTNKKLLLFDEQLKIVSRSSKTFAEIPDEEGYPADDLNGISRWLKDCLRDMLETGAYEIDQINFSTYGASFVHLDGKGRPVAPLYNYTKPFPEALRRQFYARYGAELEIARQTASPPLGMLNSGLQIYWLKYARPDIFRQVRYSLHLPQYAGFVFTGVPLSDYTSVGCHTALWDFDHNDYHEWVYAEGIDRILPPLVDTSTRINLPFEGKRLSFGVGIHDSSASLLPYLLADSGPFLLLSTGTWSIALNPFSEDPLSAEDLAADCLHFMRPDGRTVRAARLFLGYEHQMQTTLLETDFGKEAGAHQHIGFDEALYQRISAAGRRCFALPNLPPGAGPTEPAHFQNFEEAYHQLVWELALRQVESARRAIGRSPIRRVYLDGGFAGNTVFVEILARLLPEFEFRPTEMAMGAALGAAMILR